MITLATPVEEISGIGPYYQKRLKRLGIKTVRDVLFHFPHRYDDFSNLISISHIKEGSPAFVDALSGKLFCFQGEIAEIKNIKTFRKKMILTQAILKDETGKLKVLWFNQPYLISAFKKGDFVCLAGKIVKKGRAMYLSSPAYEKLGSMKHEETKTDLTHTGRLVPVYPETEGLSSKWLRFIVKPLLVKLGSQLADPLPKKIKQSLNLLPFSRALWQIHFPDNLEAAKEARRRFAFEELFDLSCLVQIERIKLNLEKALPVPLNLPLMKKFVQELPFQLTNAQKKAAWQILKDMEKQRPMNRLLQGDVGSGKTVVAAMAVLAAAKAGFQTAFMSPTEILANQHFETLKKLLKNFKVDLGLLTGRKKLFGGRQAVVGTHALIQDKVKFDKLALVVIDEQHRFGVEQRAKLVRGAGHIPHLLSMTATPIPRTLSLTLYGDLDLSLLDEMPLGRKKIITKVVGSREKKETYEFIRNQIKEGRQAFVICPRIEPKNQKGETKEWGQSSLKLNFARASALEVKAVKEEYEKLSKDIFPDLRVGMLHGKMKSEEKKERMRAFQKGFTDILVSTSVVEVGVDVPNATIMLIEGAEKFGLAQLHQFRGRVGRAKHQSWCFLFSDSAGTATNKRLRALMSCDDGFKLAEKDLQIRGPGDFLGQRQWGIPDLAMASLKDLSLVEKARQMAKDILGEDPQLKKYPLLWEKLQDFRKRVHLE